MPTLLITGASRGLGLEFVRQYTADGWNVIAACRQPAQADKLQALIAKYKTIRAETLDVARPNSINALAERLKDAAVDVLINNAGVFSGGSFSGSATKVDHGQKFGTINPEEWDKVLRINTIAPILMIQAFVPHLLKGQERKAVNITSRMGSIEEMGADYIAYRTSKAALNAAMRTIAHDLKEQKITVINLHPGWVKTDMGGPEAPLDAENSITGMRKVIAGLTPKDSSRFLGYDGKTIPW